MAFFTFMDTSDPAGLKAFSPPPRKDPEHRKCTLRLYVDNPSGAYAYAFMRPTYVLWHADDTIEFTIRNEIPNTRAVLHKHVATDDGGVKVWDAIAGAEIAAPTAYARGPTSIILKFNITRDQMIHLGLIVEVIPDGGGTSEFMLCDPQVGSGPP